MYAWEAIQKSLDHIEENLSETIEIDELAKVAALSPFYYQRLFTRLVKISVREYIKLRRLAVAVMYLEDTQRRIIDVALDVGFNNPISFSRSFKEVYAISPSYYQKHQIPLHNFEKPDLSLSHIVVEEGEPLISEGVVLAMQQKSMDHPRVFGGVVGYYPFKYGKMLGERTGIDPVEKIWQDFFQACRNPRFLREGTLIGVSYPGEAPAGYSSYFVGAEIGADTLDMDLIGLTRWTLPARDYIVCSFETTKAQMIVGMGKAMRYTRFWLKKQGLIADGYFPELYQPSQAEIMIVELWIPFKMRENF
ncbi:helix-turn-helix domain-containing protein [Enterococcus sp.]|uniref:helix-turn-helix domain-containing protein n=1 Tax=Enterococcus sp. TaxID=35783 RepID=UPI0025BB62D5|nr:helix-turn-helix domain-containing protein [Enterococcus sp.]